METKNFIEEVSGMAAIFCGVVGVLWFAFSGNPNTLGENLFWAVAAITFCLIAVVTGLAVYTAFTVWHKRNPNSFTTFKRIILVKTNRLITNLWADTTD